MRCALRRIKVILNQGSHQKWADVCMIGNCPESLSTLSLSSHCLVYYYTWSYALTHWLFNLHYITILWIATLFKVIILVVHSTWITLAAFGQFSKEKSLPFLWSVGQGFSIAAWSNPWTILEFSKAQSQTLLL